MKVLRAKTAGFCMGVALALQKLDTALEQAQNTAHTRIVTLGPIIHNPQVLESYEKRGVHCLQHPQEAQEGDCVLIRAHGIPWQDEDTLHQRHATIIDATCPKVKKAQLAIAEATQKNAAMLLLFGESDHPEVRGLVSYAKHDAVVFTSLDALQELTLMPQKKYVLASQTTQDIRVFEIIEKTLLQRLPHLTVLSTICNATHRRQEELTKIAEQVDAVVVIGGKKSGNTRRLADIVTAKNVPVWHVETADALYAKNFCAMRSVALTAGASTPKILIDEAQAFLESLSSC